MNSSKKNETQYLARISPAKARSFFLELANLRRDGVQRFLKHFEKLLPHQFIDEISEYSSKQKLFKEKLSKLLTEEEKERGKGIKYIKGDWASYNILQLSNLIRRIWIEKDLRTKKYGVFLLWKWAMFPRTFDSVEFNPPSMPSKLPLPSLFEQALQHLLDGAVLTRQCKNPECLTPYFFATRQSQKYCSDACAKPAQREFKRKWWAEHGEEWRAKRKKAAKKGK